MKHILRITLVSLLVLSFNTNQARADDEALAAIGGFVAGVITGAVVDHHSDNVHISVGARYGHDRHYDRGRGHWEIRRIRVWVPGRWTVRIDRCGERIRVWQKGHYTWRRDRVWVSSGRRDHRDYRHDRRGHDCDRHCDHDRGYRSYRG